MTGPNSILKLHCNVDPPFNRDFFDPWINYRKRSGSFKQNDFLRIKLLPDESLKWGVLKVVF